MYLEEGNKSESSIMSQQSKGKFVIKPPRPRNHMDERAAHVIWELLRWVFRRLWRNNSGRVAVVRCWHLADILILCRADAFFELKTLRHTINTPKDSSLAPCGLSLLCTYAYVCVVVCAVDFALIHIGHWDGKASPLTRAKFIACVELFSNSSIHLTFKSAAPVVFQLCILEWYDVLLLLLYYRNSPLIFVEGVCMIQQYVRGEREATTQALHRSLCHAAVSTIHTTIVLLLHCWDAPTTASGCRL